MSWHPIRHVKRKLRTTTRKVTAGIAAVAVAGGGSGIAAPDSVPGQMSNGVVQVVEHELDGMLGR